MCDDDIVEFLTWCRDIIKKEFETGLDDICPRLVDSTTGKVDTPESIRGLMFGHYMDKRGKVYTEVEGTLLSFSK